ncbi:hypothetical protein HN51_052141 [Arachis hypogaea]|uniref:Uncharacterized protein n=1 Tax=Arachis hypogaea TaxID=3818 RepID=A0A445CC02_ARAHY|nr:transcription factor SFP1 [Arachis ipaensis]XP_025668662.1 transcription factor SFP1-like [Arachis hypogaea]QHN93419.1 uncharacterized protein DS421_17g592520 [Arachis hypogaea]RYR48449.1 hypothetical protein Ahy_A07g034476 [Arachis hypogaea]
MPQKKKQLRFKIPWISSSGARAPPSKQKSKPERPPFRPPGIAPAPALPHSSPSSQSQQQQEREAPSHPAQSPASSVILDSPVSSPSRTPHSAEFKKEPEEAKEIVLVMEHEAIKEESIERKMMFATSSSSGKDIKVVSNSGNTSTMNVTSTTIPLKEEKQHHVNNQLQKGIKENISCFVQKLATVTPTQPPTEVDDDHKSFSVVTLAGDNKGATMHVAEGSSNKTKKDGSIRIHRAYKKKNPEEEEEETTDAGDENDASASEKKDDDDDDDDVAANKAYVNSNIQSVNNSVMVQGSVSERDPGVRVALPNYQQSHEPKAPALETRKVEMNGNRVSYPRPVVRRRCLRGLFMEPSDSEPDNPDKPRRHGCKFRCGDNNKAADIM